MKNDEKANDNASQIDQLDRVVTAALSDGIHTEKELIDTVEAFRPVAAAGISDAERDELVARMIERLNISMERGVVLKSHEYVPWLAERRRDIRWDRWVTYKQFLGQQKWPSKVIENLDELTDDILDLVGDPLEPGAWARRGLVLGDVQSGKTASYLGLFNKAADAGYRLIIVLAGHTESLRQQTQTRVDEAFIGRDSSASVHRAGTAPQSRLIGVGRINRTIANANGMTTLTQDFTKKSKQATSIAISRDAAHPYVFVVKKNKWVLNALAGWLSEQSNPGEQLDTPLLLLDDESDYASVNTKSEDDPTAINAAIRKILDQFSRSSYVAYTATPFANIFINHEFDNDLFPRDFIYSLSAPSNYIGSKETFGTTDAKNTRNVRELIDAETYIPLKHKSSYRVPALPRSLIDSLQAFVLSNAIRDLRNDNRPRSMLVNVSRFKAVQKQVFELVSDEIASVKNAIELYSVMHKRGKANTTISVLEEVFAKEYGDCGVTWDEVLDVLAASSSDIRVQVFNSDTDKNLEDNHTTWDRPQRLVAVGGDVLSRGLTLDGLTVSYFYRSSQASDTLLQMARWFGYRDGYHDLCRVWIDPAVAADYRFVFESVEELRTDLRTMLRQNLTPRDFGLAVRKHPGALLVTAKNKMRSAETRPTKISLIARRLETTKLSFDQDLLQGNSRSVDTFIRRLTDADEISFGKSRRMYPKWTHVPKNYIADLLDNFTIHPQDEIFSQNAIGKFVRNSSSPGFQYWDVVLVNGTKTDNAHTKIGGTEFYAPRRSFTVGPNQQLRLGGNSARLAGADDLINLIDEDATIERVRQDFRETKEPGTDMEKISYPESIYYPVLPRPAILIYALRSVEKDSTEESVFKKLRSVDFVVALKLAIPGDSTDVKNSSGDVEYVINSVAIETWFPEYLNELGDDDV